MKLTIKHKDEYTKVIVADKFDQDGYVEIDTMQDYCTYLNKEEITLIISHLQKLIQINS